MIYLCDVCRDCESVSSVDLEGYERLFALKLVDDKRQHKTLTTCRLCYKKLRFFKKRLILKLKIRMHYPNYPPEKEGEFPDQFFELKEPTNAQIDEFLSPMEDQNLENQNTETCTDDYNCQCDNCQKKYGDLPILLQGIEQKTFNDKTDSQPSTSSHSSPSKRILTCEYCKKTFTHKGDFNKHLRKHTKEKPFSCKVCGRKFGHTSNLLRHQRLHSGEKPFTCDNCSKKFSRKDKLDCHKRSRTCYDASTSRSLFNQ
ncbi:unnamed protein product [Phyllotreta striolata]|uniref:C2H2-type domain-containing protein n=1 Tax=Phyllotreta striolata TaxID=444603 RepID=A0A9N9TR19_PHYSR|nr:unnamed protein product [Phyllotreta striolata]